MVVLSIVCICYTSYHHHGFLQVTASVTYEAFVQLSYTSYHHHDFLQVTASVTYEAFAQLSNVCCLRMEVDDNDGGE